MQKYYHKFEKNWNFFLPMKYNNYRYFLNSNIRKLILKCYISYLNSKYIWFLVNYFFIDYHKNSNIKIIFNPMNKTYCLQIGLINNNSIKDINDKIIFIISNTKNYYWYIDNNLTKRFIKKSKINLFYLSFFLTNLELQNDDLYLSKIQFDKCLISLEFLFFFKSNCYLKYNYNLLSFSNIIYKNKYII